MHFISNRNIFCTLLLGITSVVGDYLVNYSKLHIFQAIFDNATHAIVGALSWLIICLNIHNRQNPLVEIALCAIIASLIDIDHFISAKSLYLSDATNLNHRPLLHCSTIPLVLCLLISLLSYNLNNSLLSKLSLILLTAFASHHTRDATRRGYWLYPFGSTPPIPYILYITITCIIPFGICWLHTICVNSERTRDFYDKGKETVI